MLEHLISGFGSGLSSSFELAEFAIDTLFVAFLASELSTGVRNVVHVVTNVLFANRAHLLAVYSVQPVTGSAVDTLTVVLAGVTVVLLGTSDTDLSALHVTFLSDVSRAR